MTRILAADIGGTNSRFAAFDVDENGRLVLQGQTRLKTNQSESFNHLLEQVGKQDFPLTPDAVDIAVFAVPGPVMEQRRATLANVPWEMDTATLDNRFEGRPLLLINDFQAQGFGCLSSAIDGALHIKDGRSDPEGSYGVIGAGTGLGHCMVHEINGRFLALPSEAGHAAFPFHGRGETRFEAFLLAEAGVTYPYGDLVVSGPGLSLLHKFLTGEELTPEDVAARIEPHSETTVWFSRFYARAARNYAFTIKATRGMFISGGVAAQNPIFVEHESFREEFLDTAHYREMLESIPILLNRNTDSGLWGAAFYGAMELDLNPAHIDPF